MKTVIIIHGSPDEEEYKSSEYPSPSNSHWIPWLQKELCKQDTVSIAPEMPRPYDPVYTEYIELLKNFVITPDTILVGHSSGAGFLLRYLSEHSELSPGKVILIAPWIDPDKELEQGFFDFDIDAELTNRMSVDIFYSTNDSPSCVESAKLVKKALSGAVFHEYHNAGHFTAGDGYNEFKDLLDVIL